MKFILFPPEKLVEKMVPILCRIVGGMFIVGGILELLLVPFLLLAKGENSLILAFVLFLGALFSIGGGIMVLKFMPKFMLFIHQRRKEQPFLKKL